MSAADVLASMSFVPVVPDPSQSNGASATLAPRRVPVVPFVPDRNEGTKAMEITELKTRLLAAADVEGVDEGLVGRLSNADIDACAEFSEASLRAYVLAMSASAARMLGKIPLGDDAAVHCARCGPVWLHPDVAAVLPVVDGWPRALGCPWCFIRRTGGHVPHATRAE